MGLTVPGTVKSYTPITQEMLARPPDGDWLMHYRTYSGWSNSPLTQITPKNVGGLQLKWAWPLEDGMRQQMTPLVHDGVMFLSTNMTNTVQALDARTGDLLWEHRLGPIGTAGQNATRTMALYGNLLFYPATDATLYALDARTGNIVWKSKVGVTPDDKIGGIMMAKDKLLVGLTRCNDLDARDHCFIAGYEASHGEAAVEVQYGRPQGHAGRRYVGGSHRRPTLGRRRVDCRHLRSSAQPGVLGHGPGEGVSSQSTRSMASTRTARWRSIPTPAP